VDPLLALESRTQKGRWISQISHASKFWIQGREVVAWLEFWAMIELRRRAMWLATMTERPVAARYRCFADEPPDEIFLAGQSKRR